MFCFLLPVETNELEVDTKGFQANELLGVIKGLYQGFVRSKRVS